MLTTGKDKQVYNFDLKFYVDNFLCQSKRLTVSRWWSFLRRKLLHLLDIIDILIKFLETFKPYGFLPFHIKIEENLILLSPLIKSCLDVLRAHSWS